MTIKRLECKEFTWERWGGRYFGLDQILNGFGEDTGYSLKKEVIPLGYIESNKLHIRPRPRGISLLLKFKGEEEVYWIHCPEFGMEKILSVKE